MDPAPEVTVLKLEYGPMPGLRRLNPMFPPGAAVLRATLRIRWRPGDARRELGRLERELLAFSPRFAAHECRGARAYHVFAGGSEAGAPRRPEGPAAEAPVADAAAAPPAAPADGGPPARGAAEAFDGGLALAHLIEHAAIDFQCGITGQRRCSGATASHLDDPNRYDVILECGDQRAARLSLALAVSWLASTLEGRPPGLREKQLLAAAALAYHLDGRLLTPPAVARALCWPQERATWALEVLRDAGYLRATPYTVNLSGIPEYRIDAG